MASKSNPGLAESFKGSGSQLSVKLNSRFPGQDIALITGSFSRNLPTWPLSASSPIVFSDYSKFLPVLEFPIPSRLPLLLTDGCAWFFAGKLRPSDENSLSYFPYHLPILLKPYLPFSSYQWNAVSSPCPRLFLKYHLGLVSSLPRILAPSLHSLFLLFLYLFFPTSVSSFLSVHKHVQYLSSFLKKIWWFLLLPPVIPRNQSFQSYQWALFCQI